MYKSVECKTCLIWNNLPFSNIYKDSKFCKYGKGYMPKESRLLCNKYKELKKEQIIYMGIDCGYADLDGVFEGYLFDDGSIIGVIND